MAKAYEKAKDHIPLPFLFDVKKLQQEVLEITKNDFFIHSRVCTLRGPAHQINPSIPTPKIKNNLIDGSWCDWLDTEDLKSSSYLNEIIGYFKKYTTVNLIRLIRLDKEAIIKEKTIPHLGLEVENSVIRLHLPVFNVGERFFLNDTIIPMKMGECWYLKLTEPHRIENGTTESVHITIDLIPNDWLKQLLSLNI